MQLRKNQAGDVQQAVVKMRSSFVEPTLERIRHSLQDPSRRILGTATTTTTAPSPMVTAAAIGIHEPGWHGAATIQPSTAPPTVAKLTIQPMHHKGTVSATLGPIGTARRIIQREGFLALYKGLTAVYTGIIPKMAIRFVSFEQYREAMHDFNRQRHWGWSPTSITFTAGLFSGLTEAILVVTPSETCKIRMMSQYHSLSDPSAMKKRKYTNVIQTALVIVREEGFGALYKGVVPTMLRQGCNQAVNFTAYNIMKKRVMEWQQTTSLDHWQSLLLGGVSGGMGPLVGPLAKISHSTR